MSKVRYKSSQHYSTLSNHVFWSNIISKYPILKKEEQLELFKKYKETQDVQYLNEVVLSHLRTAIHMLKSLYHFSPSQETVWEDLLQEAYIGLLMAVRRFDPDMGVEFNTYAYHWIKNFVIKFLIKNHSILSPSTSTGFRKIYHYIHQLQKQNNYTNGKIDDKTICAISNKLKISTCMVEHVAKWMIKPQSIHHSSGNENDESWGLDEIPGVDIHQESIEGLYEEYDTKKQMKDFIAYAMQQDLSLNEKRILKHRLLRQDREEKLNQTQIGEMGNVTKQRIEQIEKKLRDEKLKKLWEKFQKTRNELHIE